MWEVIITPAINHCLNVLPVVKSRNRLSQNLHIKGRESKYLMDRENL